MSAGPGRVERAIRDLVAKRGKVPGQGFRLRTKDICQAAFGDGPWTTAHTVSALRALRRIIAADPTGWTASFVPLRDRNGDTIGRQRNFHWWQPLPPMPKVKPPKPTKVHEPIAACVHDLRADSRVWSDAVITSRGGADPKRITVRWNERTWQCREPWNADYSLGKFDAETAKRELFAGVNFEWASNQVEFWRSRAVGQRYYNELRQRMGRGVSEAELEMLDLRLPFTTADVLKAYRSKAHKAHPDHGGDAAFMRALVLARDAALADAVDDEAPRPATEPAKPRSARTGGVVRRK